MVIGFLSEDGFFENEWIDEGKFRPSIKQPNTSVIPNRRM